MSTQDSTHETQRLGAIERLGILDTPPEVAFDRITRMAARLFEVPIALVTLVTQDRQWFKSRVGLNVCETSRGIAFCSYTIERDEVMIVPDALNDPRFASNPMVTGEPYIRFYAGAPLRARDGFRLGTLCVIDTQPRDFNAEEAQMLSDLAALVVDEMELRVSGRRLGQSEARFKSAFEMSAVGMALVSLDGRWLQVNQSLCRALGYEEDELLATSFQALTHPNDLDLDLRYVRRLLRGDISNYEIEKRYIHKSGSIAWAQLNVALVRGEAGEPLYFIAQVQDITSRKADLAAWKESEARKAAILETALDCIVSISHEGRVIEWNPAAEKAFGYSRDEALCKYLHELIVPPELRESHMSGLSKYLQTGQGPILGQRLELPAVRKDGKRIAVELAVVPIPDAEPPMFTGHLRDITARQAAETALRESEARYERITANVPGMVYQFLLRTDGSYCFPFVGQGSRDIIGLEPHEAQADAMRLTSMVPAEDKADFLASIVDSARSLSPWKWVGRIVLPSGEQKWIEGSSRPKREENGDILWDGILLDVTERIEAEESLQRARHESERLRVEAEKANLAKSEFLGRMSHELRTPLNAILGFGQLLDIAELDEADRESVAHILSAGRHLLGLINEVLDIARIESGKLALSVEPVPLDDLCFEALDLVRPLAAQNKVTLDAEKVSSCICHVMADRQRLKQVLLNLLSNAIKYNREGGFVRIECEHSDNGRARLLVHDTGQGIAPEMMERLFTPFDRLGAEQSSVEGTGVGLALSRRLSEMMGGSISVHSTLGEGSTFSIELPVAESPQTFADRQEAAPDEPKPLLRLFNTQRLILYVEDNLSNLQLVQCLLAPRPEVKLLTAMQGGLGIELAKMHRPDLILLDLHLPGMTGHEVLQRLQTEPQTRDIPVVVISADATPGQIQRLMQAGAHGYLTKPFQVLDFWRVLNDSLPPKPAPQGEGLAFQPEVKR